MLSKTSAYVKSHDGKTKWMYIFTEDDKLIENITLIGVKAALI